MVDLIGQKFWRLTVLEDSGERYNGNVIWKCLCDCGNIKYVRGDNLISGNTKSCKCLQKEKRIKHGYYGTITYRSWDSMKQRCDNPNHKHYKNYGGRGITYCKRWKDFRNFIKDMGERPKGMTIDRINNDSNYEPSNCRWADWKTQANNKR